MLKLDDRSYIRGDFFFPPTPSPRVISVAFLSSPSFISYHSLPPTCGVNTGRRPSHQHAAQTLATPTKMQSKQTLAAVTTPTDMRSKHWPSRLLPTWTVNTGHSHQHESKHWPSLLPPTESQHRPPLPPMSKKTTQTHQHYRKIFHFHEHENKNHVLIMFLF